MPATEQTHERSFVNAKGNLTVRRQFFHGLLADDVVALALDDVADIMKKRGRPQ